VTRHFVFYVARSTRNRLVRQARRLRTPRYAIAVLAGLAYFFFIFGGWTRPSPGEQAIGAQYLAAARTIGPLFLGILAAWWWLWGGHRHGLVLTPAETHLLVPAPLRRRDIVRFKVLNAQLPIFFSALLATLLTRATVLPWPLRLLSLWVLFATLHQHQVAASLVNAAAEQQGRAGLRRQRVPLILFGTALLVVAVALLRAGLEIRAAFSPRFAVERLAAVMAEPAPHVVLTPFRLLLEPLVATTPAEWALAFIFALVVLAAHYAWLQRTDAAFEEAAAAQGAVVAERQAAVRRGGAARLWLARSGRGAPSRPLLPLAPSGPAAWAVLWKNLLYLQRIVRPTTVVIALVGLLVLAGPGIAASGSPDQALRRAGIILLLLGGMVLVVGPLAIRNDLRLDLGYMDALRTWPLRGRDLVAAEVGAAALIVAGLHLPLVVAGIAALTLAGSISVLTGLAGVLLALLLLPPLIALAVTIQNAIALLYPGWVRLGGHGSGGMEAIGQNLLTLIGTLLLLVVTAIPPLIVGGVVAAPLVLLAPPIAIPAGVIAAAATTAAEVWLLVRWLGRLFDRTDPVEAGLLR
jgi:ABC-2 type transport system permease protein